MLESTTKTNQEQSTTFTNVQGQEAKQDYGRNLSTTRIDGTPFTMVIDNHRNVNENCFLAMDEPRNYKVYLTSTPSNLNRGEIWYFICPQTKKRCRKLYSIGGYFLHREAFNGCMYKIQIESKKK